MSPAPHGHFSRAMGVSHHAREPVRPGVCGCHWACCLAIHGRVSHPYLSHSALDCAPQGGGTDPAPLGPFRMATGVFHHAREPGRLGLYGIYPMALMSVASW